MDRKEFLSSLGMSATTFALINCVGCMKSSTSAPSGTTGATNVDFTLDLNASSNASLQTKGGYMITNGVIVARTTDGKYIAVQQSCTHENYTLVYNASNDTFYCNNHGAVFSETGAVLNGPASRALTTYKTSLSGTTLRVYA